MLTDTKEIKGLITDSEMNLFTGAVSAVVLVGGGGVWLHKRSHGDQHICKSAALIDHPPGACNLELSTNLRELSQCQ